jgi:hypothetical protein
MVGKICRSICRCGGNRGGLGLSQITRWTRAVHRSMYCCTACQFAVMKGIGSEAISPHSRRHSR